MKRSGKQLEGHGARAIERLRERLAIVTVLFAGAFLLLAGRTLELGIAGGAVETTEARTGVPERRASRADIVDRNGIVLATNLELAALYARPRLIDDPESLARRLVRILPDLSQASVAAALASRRSFVYIKRRLTPRQLWAVNALGEVGLGFEKTEERVYPQGRLAAHVVGYSDIDGHGIAGIEKSFDDRLDDPALADRPLRLALDLRVQHAVVEEVSRAIGRFRARAGGGLVLDVRTGEILAMASLPDFDPHNRPDSNDPALFNRMTMGVYELGSVFKTFTIAMALETGTVTLADGYDASEPIRVGRFLIRDDHPQGRYLTIPEIFVHSSNIGAAKLALDVGADTERRFLDRLGLLRRASIELPEVGRPLLPDHWRELATMTIAYGHGIAVSPLQAATAFAAIVNGGYLTPATLIAKDPGEEVNRVPILSPATSARMRELLRLAVTEGTGRQADVPGYRVGGKTGTAEKPRQGGYAKSALLSSFIGVFPIDDPRYVVFVMLDEPQGTEATFHYASAGWTAAPTVAQIILRTAPLLGVQPAPEDRGLYHQAALLIRDRGEVP